MKFTKEDAGKELTAKLASKVEGIDKWKRTITENVETLWTLLGENSEIELSDFVEKALPLFNTTAGFLRKETSELAKTYEAKIKEIENIPNPQNNNQGNSENQPSDDFIKRLEALENENRAQKEIIKKKELSAQLVAKMKEKGIKNDKWIETLMPNVTFEDDFNVEEAADKYLALYNSMKVSETPQMTPFMPNGGTGNYQNDTIKAAAAMVKQSSLIGKS